MASLTTLRHLAGARALFRSKIQVLIRYNLTAKMTTATNMRDISSNINVQPATALVDEKVDIRITGIEPESRVTIRASIEERGMTYESHAHYLADPNGLVNLSRQQSFGGTYTGMDGMGLLWSMQQSPGQGTGVRFMKLDVDTPIVVDLSLHKGYLDIAALQDAIPMTSTRIHRWYKADNVERIPIRSGNIRGVLLKPKGSGPYPGIIDMFGSTGGNVEFRAALLASRGFAVLTLPYFRYEDLPDSHWNLDFEYFEESAHWLSNLPYIRPGGIGVIGTSLGGTIALLMATHCPDMVSAAVCISGLCVSMFPFSLRHRGQHMPMIWFEPSRSVKTYYGMNALKCTEDIRTLPENAIIQVEKAHNLLFIVGEDDNNIPSLAHAINTIESLKRNGHQRYKLLSYPGAGHLIEPPYSVFGRSAWHGEMDCLLDVGGNTADNARAQEDSWPKLLQFLRKHVGVNGDN